MEMQLQTKDTLATLHLDPRTKLYLLIVGNVALFLAPSYSMRLRWLYAL